VQHKPNAGYAVRSQAGMNPPHLNRRRKRSPIRSVRRQAITDWAESPARLPRLLRPNRQRPQHRHSRHSADKSDKLPPSHDHRRPRITNVILASGRLVLKAIGSRWIPVRPPATSPRIPAASAPACRRSAPARPSAPARSHRRFRPRRRSASPRPAPARTVPTECPR
jgi:hypothetical protein